MLVLDQVKLDYKDVLIVPQRSNLGSRADVFLKRIFQGKWATTTFICCPIIIANMWNTGTKEMALATGRQGCLTALHKFYSTDELKEFLLFKERNESRICFLTIGESKEDLQKIIELRNYSSDFTEGSTRKLTLFINIDVANGYRNSFVDFVKKVREICLTDWIMAGNVTTPEMTQELILAGADIVKIGIGPGCFVRGTKVNTENGLKSIEKIKLGERVLTHDGSYQEVESLYSRLEKERLIDVNGIKCTPNHEFYVVHKDDINKLDENNLNEVAQWVSAEELSEDYMLIEITE